MIVFPSKGIPVFAHLTPQGWLVSFETSEERFETWLFDAEARKISDAYLSIRYRNNDRERYGCIAFPKLKKFWTETGSIGDKPWEFRYARSPHLQTFILGDDDKDVFLRKLLNIRQGIGIEDEHRAVCLEILPGETIFQHYLSHDGCTVCVLTNKSVVILDNPLSNSV